MSGLLHLARWGAPLCLAMAVAGCGSVAQQSFGSSPFVDPGKFAIYTCKDVANLTLATQVRQRELEQLMSRASQDVGGQIVNAIAYRSEFAQNRDTLALLSRAKEDKQCAVDSPFSSGRSVF